MNQSFLKSFYQQSVDTLVILFCTVLFFVTLTGVAVSLFGWWLVTLAYNPLTYTLLGPGFAVYATGWLTDLKKKPRADAVGIVLANILYVIYFTAIWLWIGKIIRDLRPTVI